MTMLTWSQGRWCLKNNKKSQPNSLLVNDKLISKPKDVANTFNNYFSSIASSLQNKIHHHGKEFSHFLKEENPNSFFINPTDSIEVINQINGLNSNKAEGPTSIPTNIFQLITPTMPNHLLKSLIFHSTEEYILTNWRHQK